MKKTANEGYTLIYPVNEDEIGYMHVDTISEAEEKALNLLEESEVLESGEDYSCIIFIAHGKIEPLKVIFTKGIKIIDK